MTYTLEEELGRRTLEMSDSVFDIFLDKCVDEYYEDTEDFEPEPEWDGPYPEDDYDYCD